MQAFINFKNYLRMLIKRIETLIKPIQEQINNYSDVLENWDDYEIKVDSKKLTFFQKFYKRLMPKTYKNEYLKLIKKERLIQINKKDFYQHGLNYLRKMVASFDNEKAIALISDIPLLIFLISMAINNGFISNADGIKILGSVCYCNNKRKKKNNDNKSEVWNIISNLATYFNEKGDFVISKSSSEILNLLNLLNTPNEDTPKNEDELKYEKAFIQEASKLYEEFLKTHIPEKKNETPTIIRKPNHDYLKELSKYYKNGKLVRVPYDLEAFDKLLDNCMIDDIEKRYIFSLIYNYLEEERTTFIESSSMQEDEIINDINILLNSLNPSSPEATMIKSELFKLRNLKDNFKLGSIPYTKARKQIFDNLATYLRIFNQYCINNLVFLTDPKGIVYFNEDLKEIDNSLKKAVLKTLAKINENNKVNFHQVIAENHPEVELFEVSSFKIHIIFIEIDPGIYLVLGAAIRGKNYQEIANRYFQNKNQDFINSIKELIKDPIQKEKLLTDQELVIKNGIKLIRGTKNGKSRK